MIVQVASVNSNFPSDEEEIRSGRGVFSWRNTANSHEWVRDDEVLMKIGTKRTFVLKIRKGYFKFREHITRKSDLRNLTLVGNIECKRI